MRHYRLIIGLIISQALLCSCDKNVDTSQKLDYNYKSISSNLSNTVNCVCFIDSITGFVGSYGKIFKTNDGGINWSNDNMIDSPINSIYFINDSVGFAVGGESQCFGTDCQILGSIVYKTTDSGNTWKKKSIPYEWSELNSVFFVNKEIGFAIGLGLNIKTKDGGET